MSMEIRPFDAATASERELSEYHLASAAAWRVDFPEEPPAGYEATVGRLRTPWPHEGRCRYWAAYVDGVLVGLGRLALQDGENSGIAQVTVTVHPEYRRRGIGTAVLRAVLPAVRETGRPTVTGEAMKSGSPGDLWAARFGFRAVNRTAIMMLMVDETEPERWDVPVPAGYRLAGWVGTAPEELIEAYAAAREAVQDAPMGESSIQIVRWDAERIRREERELADQGAEERVVVAVHEASGEIAGVTGLLTYAYRPDKSYVNDTSVVRAHRGHGLGRALKAAMTRQVLRERPQVRRIVTSNNEDNVHMIAVNEAIGYQVLRRLIWVETTADGLTGALSR
ncbi:GNAT family N-acetyltransferase [Kitasatospora sp. NBC_01250]|uniref:GNAT family N-acetyltransferase n=1 Tax=Kitasatospora sp. NBC_01250 TaxID=2903571 RepID=UPI002E2F13B5|nr:GNAT family N-acetyltransferase [Kitasatospora sp. NBC_01250]